jgi:hypothetical protein
VVAELGLDRPLKLADLASLEDDRIEFRDHLRRACAQQLCNVPYYVAATWCTVAELMGVVGKGVRTPGRGRTRRAIHRFDRRDKWSASWPARRRPRRSGEGMEQVVGDRNGSKRECAYAGMGRKHSGVDHTQARSDAPSSSVLIDLI